MKLAVLVLAAMGPLAGGASAAQTTSSTCSNVSASLGAGGNGMTGGVFEWSLSITNRGGRACTVYGRPFVRVAPTAYPVTIAGLQPGEFGLNARTEPIRLAPGTSARAAVLIVRNCGDFSKRVARTLRVTVGWARGAATVSGEACADGGATVIVGPFHRT